MSQDDFDCADLVQPVAQTIRLLESNRQAAVAASLQSCWVFEMGFVEIGLVGSIPGLG
jgi:hypothetical protein